MVTALDYGENSHTLLCYQFKVHSMCGYLWKSKSSGVRGQTEGNSHGSGMGNMNLWGQIDHTKDWHP